MPTFDPVASLRMWAVEVELGSHTLRIPPLPAADWLPAMMRLDVLSLLDLVEDVDMYELLVEDAVTLEAVGEAMEQLLEAAAGRPSWTALALAYIAARHWPVVGGDLARSGVRFTEIPLGAALDAIYGSLIRSMDEKSLKSFNAALERPTAEGVATSRGYPAPRPVPASAEPYVRARSRSRLRMPPDRAGDPNARPIRRRVRPAESDPASDVPGATPRASDTAFPPLPTRFPPPTE